MIIPSVYSDFVLFFPFQSVAFYFHFLIKLAWNSNKLNKIVRVNIISLFPDLERGKEFNNSPLKLAIYFSSYL